MKRNPVKDFADFPDIQGGMQRQDAEMAIENLRRITGRLEQARGRRAFQRAVSDRAEVVKRLASLIDSEKTAFSSGELEQIRALQNRGAAMVEDLCRQSRESLAIAAALNRARV